ncbi:GNAT family N-acetyltransferase [Paenibacillus silviterrae]|uniref:GNAT family N-acetyltransferase n=1 Tax=Paenibacillus silviterrae TaxID=3242194 RepID=UPI002542B9E2|nr:GNAT family N-acetyltransferase [Paenibacillus chinjuensis]
MTTTIRIRPATEEDVPFLREMLYVSVYVPDGAEPPGRDILDSPGIGAYIKDWGRPGDFGFIAETEDGLAIGSATARLFQADRPGYGFIDEATPELGIALLPAYRGLGAGTKLLQALAEEAMKRGYEALSLSVDPRNPAVRLYKRLGFVEKGMSGTSAVMRWSLKET